MCGGTAPDDCSTSGLIAPGEAARRQIPQRTQKPRRIIFALRTQGTASRLRSVELSGATARPSRSAQREGWQPCPGGARAAPYVLRLILGGFANRLVLVSVRRAPLERL